MSVHLLQTATSVLLKDPTASLSDVARAAGVGRTTLHKRFPTRAALVRAVASDALDLIYSVAREVDFGSDEALEDLVTRLVALGPRVEFLLRFPGLERDEELAARIREMDRPVLDLITRLQGTTLRRDLPAWWVLQTLYAGLFNAWEAISDGRLAPLDAPRFVLTTVFEGVASAGPADRP
ncbi:TetR/AcrR family transcriptional regulator [Lentzea jiangxiensis]|uniref:TetR/AcrR family transcriptional regulator, repressor for lfrA n=1 Tax=Lentzea jiangxiensis TaxID=641025 RepID=A0A1H0G6Y9_9PSEU|nr:TetR/AcrR family transcriptional regulator [Lentzea jiangxiensis]SDO02611.1 TetR/AcrR family transcriptional regulator, repressor for lfrA [Lentzea jiangxiensis]